MIEHHWQRHGSGAGPRPLPFTRSTSLVWGQADSRDVSGCCHEAMKAIRKLRLIMVLVSPDAAVLRQNTKSRKNTLGSCACLHLAAMELVLQDELSLIAFFAALLLLEIVAHRFIGTSPIVGQLLAGILLGPSLANIVPYSDALRLLGKLGVGILVVESGLNVDLASVLSIGPRAVGAAILGVAAPVGLSIAVLSGIFGADIRAGLAAGAAIAPTSLGFSAQLLKLSGKLQTQFGALICAAAVIDDVVSLTLLAEVQALGGDDDPTAW